jgi:transposase-like protein
MISFFKSGHFPKDVILHAVFSMSVMASFYRDLEEIMGGHSARVDLFCLQINNAAWPL